MEEPRLNTEDIDGELVNLTCITGFYWITDAGRTDQAFEETIEWEKFE